MSISLSQDDALALWRETLSRSVRDDAPDLSARQMAVLLMVYTTPPPHTVRGLSADLGIAKPAVTRALDRMSDLGLLTRGPDETDKRSILVQRTVKGAVYLSEFADTVSEIAGELPPGLEDEGDDIDPGPPTDFPANSP